MLTIEEYIAKRKQDDNIKEMNIKNKETNKSICLGYVNDYFDNYIDITSEENKSIAQLIKVEKYAKTVRCYSEENQNFLINIYSEHSNYMDRYLSRIIRREKPEFFLLSNDEDLKNFFSAISVRVFAKYPYLKDYVPELFRLLKDLQNNFYWHEIEFISKEFNDWIDKTQEKYNVDITLFGFTYAEYWFDNDRLWEKQCRIKDKKYDMYDYDWKKARNVFNIDILYSRFKYLPYIKNHKRDLEMAIMYFWCTSICGIEDDLRLYIDRFCK